MRSATQKKEFSPGKVKVPIMGYHVHNNIVTLDGSNRLFSILRFKGISHDTREKAELDNEFRLMNNFFQALGKKEGKNLMVQTWTTKSMIRLTAEYDMELPVIQDFVDAWTHPFRNGTFRAVDYGVGLILKYSDLEDGIARMCELLTIASKMLEPFGISIMGMEENKNGALFSQIGRYCSLIFNGDEQDILVSDTRLGDAVIDSETAFGAYDYVENRPNHSPRRFATTYDLRDFPAKSIPGMWDEAIEEQFDFTLVQSFLFEDRNKIKRQLNAQSADLASTEGESQQTNALQDTVQDITQGKSVIGRYWAALVVYGDTPQKAVDNGSKMESLFITKEVGFIKSTSTNIDTWLTQYPGHTKTIYQMPKATENLCCAFSLHATPSGKATGNPPGDGTAVMPLKTVKGGMYFHNLHDSPPGQNNTGERYPGHQSTIAQTGAGKTTYEATELIFLSRWNPMLMCIDYNNSLENLLRALNTQYFNIDPGRYTHIQLFQLPDSTSLRQALFDQVKMAAGTEITSDDEELEIREAIDAVLRHEKVEERCFSLLLLIIPKRGDNCLHTRLSKWCRSQNGHYAWAVDSPRNQFVPSDFRRLAFNCTKILNKEFIRLHPVVGEILLNTFYFLKSEMQKQDPGGLFINISAEVWAPLMFESTANKITEILHAGRTRGEIMMMDTQYPEQINATPYGPAVIQQVVTQLWMANKKAKSQSYADFNIIGKEFSKIQELTPSSYEFMVKQGNQAVMCTFALEGNLKYWLPLLSSDDKNLPVAARIRQELGSDDPAVWVAPFLDEMVAVKVRHTLKGELEKQKRDGADADIPSLWVPRFLDAMKALERPVSMALPEYITED